MARSTRLGKLKEIHYLLGNSCNLNCDFCLWDTRLPNSTLKLKKRIIDQIEKIGIKKVTVSGGEPLCDPDFFNVMEYMHKKGLKIILHTNGLKITKQSIKKIATFISRISLTMDGVNNKTIIQMRKNKNITKHTIFLVKQFHKFGIPVSIKTLITKINYLDIPKIGETLINLSIKHWSLFEFIPLARGKINKNKFYLDPKLFDKICANLKKEFAPLLIHVRKLNREPRKYCFIAADGKVHTYEKEKGNIIIGDLRKQSLSLIIKKI
ncbi:radical SAM protein [Patescibacteria group bacterium]